MKIYYESNFGIKIIKFNIEQRGYDLLQDNLKNLVAEITQRQRKEELSPDTVPREI